MRLHRSSLDILPPGRLSMFFQTHYLLTKKPGVQGLTGVIFKSLWLSLTYESHHFQRKCTSCHNKLWESACLKCMNLSTELTVIGFLIYTVPLSLRLSALMFTLSGLLSLWSTQHFFLHLDFTLNLALIFFCLHLSHEMQMHLVFIESSLGKLNPAHLLFLKCRLTGTT